VSRRRKRTPAPRKARTPEAEQREKQQEGWRRRAVAERQEGVSAGDAGARWLLAHDLGQSYQPSSGAWRTKPATAAQQSQLRRLGLNPTAYRTRGDASDAIARAK
jgi:hypothetical protein